VNETPANGRPLPATQHAIQIVDVGRLVHNRAKPVTLPGPHQLLVRMEACGICFSDTKLLHAFSAHPRKGEIRSGLPPDVLAEVPSYVPGERPTVPGHEPVGRIVAVGPEVLRHVVGERVLIQTDYRHLPTTGANAAFGYDFEGGLQEYVLLDERVIIEPGTGERFLIPVGEEPSASALALVEPWACVEASYVYRERRSPLRGGRMLVVVDAGHVVDGLDAVLEASAPAEVTRPDAGPLESLEPRSFDDVVYFGADGARVERLGELLAPRGLINVVTGGERIGGPVALDVGRVHYDLTRWTGTTGTSAAGGYAAIPPDGELRAGDRVAVVGAAGPMGLMHVVRAISGGWPDLAITAVDIDDVRLAHLERTTSALARDRGVRLTVANSRTNEVTPGFDYVALMVPAPALVREAVGLAGRGGRINIFAGFPIGTLAEIDLDRYIEERCYFLGTSGSVIADMKAVLAKLERGELDTNVSLDAVTGFEGVADALAAVEGRTSSGKIVVYPELPELGLVTLAQLREHIPEAAAALDEGRWTGAAERALLARAGRPAAGVSETAR
jgi:threonine dehydrogenase-like Zn-dependent dehydrogenase